MCDTHWKQKTAWILEKWKKFGFVCSPSVFFLAKKYYPNQDFPNTTWTLHHQFQSWKRGILNSVLVAQFRVTPNRIATIELIETIHGRLVQRRCEEKEEILLIPRQCKWAPVSSRYGEIRGIEMRFATSPPIVSLDLTQWLFTVVKLAEIAQWKILHACCTFVTLFFNITPSKCPNIIPIL